MGSLERFCAGSCYARYGGWKTETTGRHPASPMRITKDIGDIEIDALHGKIAVDNVVVTNPEGYYSEYLLRSGKMSLDSNFAVL